MSVKILPDAKESFKMIGKGEETWEDLDQSKLDFDVVSKPVISNDIELPDRKAIFKVPKTSAELIYLATVSKNYPIIKHSDIVTKIEESMQFTNFAVKTILTNQGAKMQRIYTLNDLTVTVRKGDEISPAIRIVNSYDGSTAVGFYIDAVRLVCTNGMVAIRQFMSMSYKHFGNSFNIDRFGSNARKLIAGFAEYSNNWRAWNEEKVDLERAALVLNYMPVRVRPLVEARYDGNFDGTKWGLYNAYTEAITHDYFPTRSKSPDSTKIQLGSDVTKMFAKKWFWTADKEEIINDLIGKRKFKDDTEEALEAEVIEL